MGFAVDCCPSTCLSKLKSPWRKNQLKRLEHAVNTTLSRTPHTSYPMDLIRFTHDSIPYTLCSARLKVSQFLKYHSLNSRSFHKPFPLHFICPFYSLQLSLAISPKTFQVIPSHDICTLFV